MPKSLTKVWLKRIKEFRDYCSDNSTEWITYNDMAAIANISKSNIYAKMSEIIEEIPDAYVEETDGPAKKFKFNFDAMLGDIDEEPENPDIVPDWLNNNSYDNLRKRLSGDVGDGRYLKFGKHGAFNIRFQRGGVTVECYEEGHRHPEWEKILRVDNCVVLN